MNNLCLYCYKELSSIEVIHKKCCKKFFRQNEIPKIDFTRDNLLDLGKEAIQNNSSVTGVQPKLSLGIKNDSIGIKKLAILGVLGNYILKPQSDLYIALPELEDLTMHLAKISKIETVDHSLIY